MFIRLAGGEREIRAREIKGKWKRRNKVRTGKLKAQ